MSVGDETDEQRAKDEAPQMMLDNPTAVEMWGSKIKGLIEHAIEQKKLDIFFCYM